MAQYQWQPGPNGQTYVNGELILPDTSLWTRTLQTDVIDRWGDMLARHAKRTGVPWPWLVGFVYAENRGIPDGVSVVDGKEGAFGLLQIMPFNFPKFFGRSATRAEMLDPDINAFTGANYIADMRAHGLTDLPSAASGYNAGYAVRSGKYVPPTCRTRNCSKYQSDRFWGPTPEDSLFAQDTYISRVVRSANYASQRMPSGLGTGVGLGTVALVGGLGYLGYRWYKGRK